MNTPETLAALAEFRDERGWNEFHTLIALSRALSIESSEIEKVFLWKKDDTELSDEDRKNLKFELADVLTYAYNMCNQMNLDPNDIVMEKLAINKERHWKFEEDRNDRNH